MSYAAAHMYKFCGNSINFYLSLWFKSSRCLLKVEMFSFQDSLGAADLATKALELKPTSFEGFYARARARRDDR